MYFSFHRLLLDKAQDDFVRFKNKAILNHIVQTGTCLDIHFIVIINYCTRNSVLPGTKKIASLATMSSSEIYGGHLLF